MFIMLDKTIPDILEKIYQFVIEENRDEIQKFVKRFQYIERFSSCNEKYIFIANYINSLKQSQVEKIIHEYGFLKSITIWYQYYKVGLGETDENICCDIANCEAMMIDREIVQLILQDAVKFNNDWRDNDKLQ